MIHESTPAREWRIEAARELLQAEGYYVIKRDRIASQSQQSVFHNVDLFGAGPAQRDQYAFEAMARAIGSHALQHIHRPQPIYYCSTDEMPLFEPCKEMKDQRDI